MKTMQTQRKKRKLMFALFAIVGAMVIGIVWAASSGTLNINGTANLGVNGKVEFVDAAFTVAAGYVEGEVTDGDDLSFTVDLAVGDEFEVTFKLENTGNVDVNITGIEVKTSLDDATETTAEYIFTPPTFTTDVLLVTGGAGISNTYTICFKWVAAAGETPDKTVVTFTGDVSWEVA